MSRISEFNQTVLDGTTYRSVPLAYALAVAMDQVAALGTSTHSDTSRTLRAVADIKLADNPDFTSDLDFGPSDEVGIDWAEAEHYFGMSVPIDTHTIVQFLLSSTSPAAHWIGINIQQLLRHRVVSVYQQDVDVVFTTDLTTFPGDLTDTDLSNIYDWR